MRITAFSGMTARLPRPGATLPGHISALRRRRRVTAGTAPRPGAAPTARQGAP